jgi:glutamate-1-semialdehyde 2,1-aminomutase
MAQKYPRATLILAHAARGFAAWTTVESVAELAGLENVWFDLSAICESPPMLAILKYCGVKRVLWGSDFPISMARGKAISLGDGFYWIYKQDLARFQAATPIRATLVGIENLLAVQEACMLLDLDKPAIEDIFYNNAMRLFRLTD